MQISDDIKLFAAFDSEQNVWGLGNTIIECFLNSSKIIAENNEDLKNLKFAQIEEPTRFVCFLSMIGNIYRFWHLTDLRWQEVDGKIRIFEVDNKGLDENEQSD